MKHAVTLGFSLLLLLFMSISMRNAAVLHSQCQSVSVRYRQPFTVQQTDDHSCTFWTEKAALLSSDYHSAQSRILFYSGDAALVYGKPCTLGTLPGPLSKNGCAVSSVLAEQLFGSENIIGLTVYSNSVPYIVHGVFEDTEPIALIPDSAAEFTAVEFPLCKEAVQDPEGWTRDQLRKEGFPSPDWILYSFELAFICFMLTWLPLLFSGILLAAWAFRCIQKKAFPVRDLILFLLALIFALILPAFFSVWPQWLTPSRWSDFSWWHMIFEQLTQHIKAFLSVIPAVKDTAIKIAFIKQFFLAAIEVGLCEILRCRLWRSQHTVQSCVPQQNSNTIKASG